MMIIEPITFDCVIFSEIDLDDELLAMVKEIGGNVSSSDCTSISMHRVVPESRLHSDCSSIG
jgi:hypothetical protein